MKQVMAYLLNKLLSEEHQYQIEENITEDTIVLEIFIPSSQVGQLLGKHGSLLKAIKTILKASPLSMGKEIVININEVKDE